MEAQNSNPEFVLSSLSLFLPLAAEGKNSTVSMLSKSFQHLSVFVFIFIPMSGKKFASLILDMGRGMGEKVLS